MCLGTVTMQLAYGEDRGTGSRRVRNYNPRHEKAEMRQERQQGGREVEGRWKANIWQVELTGVGDS